MATPGRGCWQDHPGVRDPKAGLTAARPGRGWKARERRVPPAPEGTGGIVPPYFFANWTGNSATDGASWPTHTSSSA